jgi:signal transduction histidine kinase
MKDISLAVLEGLIHNIRTPLNLILGYAQQLQKEEDNPFLERIYQAGIKIDDMLQATWEAFEQRRPEVAKICLNEWLNSELKLLNNHLQIKHRLIFETSVTEVDVWCEVSSLMLSQWFEALLLCIVDSRSESPIHAHISLYEDRRMQLDINSAHINMMAIEQLLNCDSGSSQAFLSTEMHKTSTGIQIQVRFT